MVDSSTSPEATAVPSQLNPKLQSVVEALKIIKEKPTSHLPADKKEKLNSQIADFEIKIQSITRLISSDQDSASSQLDVLVVEMKSIQELALEARARTETQDKQSGQNVNGNEKVVASCSLSLLRYFKCTKKTKDSPRKETPGLHSNAPMHTDAECSDFEQCDKQLQNAMKDVYVQHSSKKVSLAPQPISPPLPDTPPGARSETTSIAKISCNEDNCIAEKSKKEENPELLPTGHGGADEDEDDLSSEKYHLDADAIQKSGLACGDTEAESEILKNFVMDKYFSKMVTESAPSPKLKVSQPSPMASRDSERNKSFGMKESFLLQIKNIKKKNQNISLPTETTEQLTHSESSEQLPEKDWESLLNQNIDGYSEAIKIAIQDAEDMNELYSELSEQPSEAEEKMMIKIFVRAWSCIVPYRPKRNIRWIFSEVMRMREQEKMPALAISGAVDISTGKNFAANENRLIGELLLPGALLHAIVIEEAPAHFPQKTKVAEAESPKEKTKELGSVQQKHSFRKKDLETEQNHKNVNKHKKNFSEGMMPTGNKKSSKKRTSKRNRCSNTSLKADESGHALEGEKVRESMKKIDSNPTLKLTENVTEQEDSASQYSLVIPMFSSLTGISLSGSESIIVYDVQSSGSGASGSSSPSSSSLPKMFFCKGII